MCNKRNPGASCAAIEGINTSHAILGTSGKCVAVHPSDLAVSRVALGASVKVRGPKGERAFPVEELYRLPGGTPHLEHNLNSQEMIVEVRVPFGRYARRARYFKVRGRASYVAIVSTAAALDIEDGKIRAVRIACGGVGAIPWRMRICEQALIGMPASQRAFEAAAGLASQRTRPLAGNRYKVELLPRIIVRALELASEV